MKRLISCIAVIIERLNYCAPVADLMLRVYVAYAFWKAGYVKFLDMGITVQLFTHEYCVPFLEPTHAAYLCAFIELLFSVLLMLGLLGRLSAFILLVLNLIAVTSYPDISVMGVQWHIVWGIMLLVVCLRGPGKLSFDYLIWKKVTRK